MSWVKQLCAGSREVLAAASSCDRDRLVRGYSPPLQAGTALTTKQKGMKCRSALVPCCTSAGALLTSGERPAAVLQLLGPSVAYVLPSPWQVCSAWVGLW